MFVQPYRINLLDARLLPTPYDLLRWSIAVAVLVAVAVVGLLLFPAGALAQAVPVDVHAPPHLLTAAAAAVPTAAAPVVGPSSLIDISPLLDYGIEVLAALATAVALWVTKKVTGNVLDEGARSALYPAIENGIGSAAEYLKRQGRDLTQLEVRNELARAAAIYAAGAVPQAAKRFGFTADDIQRIAMAKLGLRSDVPDPVAPAPPGK